jgi:hypothetical protein
MMATWEHLLVIVTESGQQIKGSELMTVRAWCMCLVLMMASVGGVRADRPRLPEWKKRRSALDKVHVVDEFRIFYTLSGDDALPDVVDQNGNSIPDRVENVALQLTTAREIYTGVLQLRHPLEGPRYKDKARYIDVNIGVLPFEPGGAKGNGYAGDGVVNYYRPCDPETGIDVLTIDLLNTLPAENVSPAHELFHLYQNGYTMFKSSWFTEGTARWAEFTIREGSGRPMGAPSSQQELARLFAMKYEAQGFWHTLAHASDARGQLKVPADLQRVTYIGTNSPIIRDTEFRGRALLKQLLEALDEADDRMTADLMLEPFAWKEAEQRSADTYPYMWAAIIDVSRRYSRRSNAVKAMVRNLSP